MSLPCAAASLQQLVAADSQYDHVTRLAGTVYFLSLAVLSRSQGATDYFTNPTNLRTAVAGLDFLETGLREEVDIVIASNQVLAQQAAGGQVVAFPSASQADAGIKLVASLFSEADLRACQSLLNCLLTN